MISHKYGEWSKPQMDATIKKLRTQIFFLLLCVDPDTKNQYAHIDLKSAFNGLLLKLGGLNSCLNEHPALITAISLLERANIMIDEPDFNYQEYRKCILDSGSVIAKIGGE